LTPTQAAMLSNALGMMAGITADAFIEIDNHDSLRFQHTVSTECRKTFFRMLKDAKLIDQPDPPRPPAKPKKEAHP